ncbi:MAG: hypothetical protein ACYCZF_00530 [Anaerolineae bacterium]
MAYGTRILEALQTNMLAGATTSELCVLLGNASRSSIYHAARDLMLQGLVRGERNGHVWRYFATHAPSPVTETARPDAFTPLAEYTWDLVRSTRSWQTRYLVPLLESPADRAWFLRKLASPCSREEGEQAEVLHHTQPLRDLLYADGQKARGVRALEDSYITYYNDLLGLPAKFGTEHVWRSGDEHRLRLPSEPGRAGWSDNYLQAQVSSKRVLRKAIRKVELLKLQVDLALITPRHIMLVQVCRPETKASLKEYEALRGYATVLEHRLKRGCSVAFVIERAELLPANDLLFVQWSDILSRLNARQTAGVE